MKLKLFFSQFVNHTLICDVAMNLAGEQFTFREYMKIGEDGYTPDVLKLFLISRDGSTENIEIGVNDFVETKCGQQVSFDEIREIMARKIMEASHNHWIENQ